jgi:hypothetical protein
MNNANTSSVMSIRSRRLSGDDLKNAALGEAEESIPNIEEGQKIAVEGNAVQVEMARDEHAAKIEEAEKLE